MVVQNLNISIIISKKLKSESYFHLSVMAPPKIYPTLEAKKLAKAEQKRLKR